MNRIAKAFENGTAFIPFVTAGDPSIEATERFVLKMVEAGADLIEIGIPFSDPIAEGPVIQGADLRALSGGATTDTVMDMVARLRRKTDIPLVFMTYLNPVFSYGYDKFFARCEQIGIDGIIIPDMPFEEKEEARTAANSHGVSLISMIAPTSDERIARIAAEAQGFVYVVSSMGVTGVRSEITTDIAAMVSKIKQVTNTPAAVGFGINRPDQAAKIGRYADGVIVGSAIVRIVEKYGEQADGYIYDYVKEMKDACR